MELFDREADESFNLLPYDGVVNYYGRLFPKDRADEYYRIFLQSIEWRHDEVVIFGKKHITKREVAWYGDQPFNYTYSNTTKSALPWTKELMELKSAVEARTGETFNSCLMNLYHDGSEGMSWHSDSEKELKKNGAIASVSFGAERKFSFKHKKTKEKVSVLLEHASLLIMKAETQEFWLHSMPPAKQITTPRINLTFRTIINSINYD
ncbi:alpha-ketoglutarate-dependent dioxygenase AlkB [Pollutibacter soli]|uniref:alpha-ketoglutarate-dependent dioxygenase AlkB family protein n=1 Tax=Pollutibacter soli TaxID=3034157 RepID=UPI003013BCE2